MDTLQLVDDKKVQVYTLKKGINDTILYDEDAVIKRFISTEIFAGLQGFAWRPIGQHHRYKGHRGKNRVSFNYKIRNDRKSL